MGRIFRFVFDSVIIFNKRISFLQTGGTKEKEEKRQRRGSIRGYEDEEFWSAASPKQINEKNQGDQRN